MSRWNEVFYITIGVCLLGTIAFIILGSAEPQEWGLINENTDNNVKIEKSNKFKQGSITK